MEDKPKKEKKKYWYFITTHECVVCGRQEITKERRYDEKPEDGYKRYNYTQYACGSHFF